MKTKDLGRLPSGHATHESNQQAVSTLRVGIVDAHLCDVCGLHPVAGVASSGLGPVSWGYCAECASRYAEPAIMIDATLDGCGGLANVAEWARASITTFMDGEYVSFDEAARRIERINAGGAA